METLQIVNEIVIVGLILLLSAVNVVLTFLSTRMIPLDKVRELIQALREPVARSATTLDDEALRLFEQFVAWYEGQRADEGV